MFFRRISLGITAAACFSDANATERSSESNQIEIPEFIFFKT